MDLAGRPSKDLRPVRRDDYDHWLGAPNQIATTHRWDQLLYDTEQQYAAGC